MALISFKLFMVKDLAVENLALRQQLASLQRKSKRPKLKNLGSDILDVALKNLAKMAGCSGNRKTGHCLRLAQERFHAFLVF
jgi:hypothetical protein